MTRIIAENVYAAFAREAGIKLDLNDERTVLNRLVDVVRPQVASASAEAVVSVVNGALDGWELRHRSVRGPRLAAVDLGDGSVTMQPV